MLLAASILGGSLVACGSDGGGPPDAWVVVNGQRTLLHITGYCWGDTDCVDAEPGGVTPSVEVMPGEPFAFEYKEGRPATVIVTAFRTDGESEATPLTPATGGWRAPETPGTYAVSVAGTWPGKGEAAYSVILRVVP
ncbi:MAG: hypothetical protein Kow0010_09780 [Dehalococcoidia bacterium]